MFCSVWVFCWGFINLQSYKRRSKEKKKKTKTPQTFECSDMYYVYT